MSTVPAKRGRKPGPQPKRLDYADTRIAYIRALKNTLHERVKIYARRQKIPISTAFNKAIASGLDVLEGEGQTPR